MAPPSAFTPSIVETAPPVAPPPQAHPPAAWPGQADFVAALDRKLGLKREKTSERLRAWAELLDAAGWCVAILQNDGNPWLGSAARRDLQKRRGIPATWQELIDMLDGIPPRGRHLAGQGVQVWCDGMPPTGGAPPMTKLTSRESEIMEWLRQGKTAPEIAIIIGCALRTVEKHVANGYRKLGFHNRASAIINFFHIP